MKIQNPIPVKSQLDNKNRPYQTCSYTCMAMCAEKYGVKPLQPGQQLEDEMSLYYENALQLTRGNPFEMERFINKWYGNEGTTPFLTHFFQYADIDLIKDCMEQGWVGIIHGDFTPSGHVVVVTGFDDNPPGKEPSLIIVDPYGECNLAVPTYQGMPTHPGPYEYSEKAINRLCLYPDKSFWFHAYLPTTDKHILETML